MTHEQYLDEPAEVIDWALAMDSMEQEVRADAERDR